MILFRTHLESTSVVLILLLAFICAKLWPKLMARVETRIFRLANVRVYSVIVVGALSLAGSAAVVALTQIPQPRVRDEFSHLLAADTFAAGRLSNPTHPMWPHFQSFYIIQKPTYVSKFPPAQGLILAAGQVLFGYSIVGVWLSGAFACGAIYWMLLGWFRPGIAFMGALVCVSQIGVTTYWTQSYWGGMVPAMGGALVFGAVRRLSMRPSLRTSLILVIGLAALSISRPFEGLIASLPALVYLFVSWTRSAPPVRQRFARQVLIPLGFGSIAILVGIAYYNFRQTGNPFVTAYQVYAKTYQIYPLFREGDFHRPAILEDPAMRSYLSMSEHDIQSYARTMKASLPSAYSRLKDVWTFYVGLLLSVPLILAFLPPPRILWLPLFSLISVLAALLIGWYWLLPHYAAPITGPVFLLLTHGWRRLRVWRPRQRSGLFLARTLVVICFALLGARVLAAHGKSVSKRDWPDPRVAIERQLEKMPGKHLVVVRNPLFKHEWVYNRADIDQEKIVWARELDSASDKMLISYFRGRQVWCLDVDKPSPRLVPYNVLSLDSMQHAVNSSP